MKTPVPVPPAELPARSASPAPTPKLVADICQAIRGGAPPDVAAKWHGVSTKLWKRWWKRHGELYDLLRQRVSEAVTYSSVRLHVDLAAKSPGQALKRLSETSLEYARDVAKMNRDKPWEKLGLTFEEEMFCRGVTAADNPEESAVDALKKIGIDESDGRSLKDLAYNLKRKPKVIARINQLRRERIKRVARKLKLQVTGDRVIEEYARVAYAKIRERDITVDDKLNALDRLAHMLGLGNGMPMLPGTAPTQVNIYNSARIEIPDNGRDPALTTVGGATNGLSHGQPPPHAIIDLPPRLDVPSNGDQPASESERDDQSND